ncbi:formylglycine-generating enzyme family protein [Moorena sp. SIO3B2]|uniref:formylglycine-generating enzyme family protein n=1 Tax=Moorena sp. SIO3B2 TaxID=2607827 RepID=UPI00338F670E
MIVFEEEPEEDEEKLQQWTFETPTVNHHGEIIKTTTYTASYFTETLTDNVELEMVAIPGGTFTMGSPESEKDSRSRERPQHNVTLQPFFMGKYPVTQAQWKAIASITDLKVNQDLDPDPSYFKEPYQGIDRWQRPVEKVNWYQAVEFCQRLSKLTGREYRLPSEAQWEYACRGVTEPLKLDSGESYPPFYFGETITGQLANYDASSTYADEEPGERSEGTTPVGEFPPNPFGLYDMHGNVWEWCADDWHDNYEDPPTDGSAWIDNNEPENVNAKNNPNSATNDENNPNSPLRGGYWAIYPTFCRSAFRNSVIRRVDRINYFGFRLVCVSGRTG